MERTELLGQLISDILADSPPAARVFLVREMACPGCPFARFETLADAAAAYGRDPHALADELIEAASSPGGRDQ